jgi:hypothetical protein
MLRCLENEDYDPDCLFTITPSDGSKQDVPLTGYRGDEKVTPENKQQYIDASLRFRLVDEIREQREAFKRGFQELLPRDEIKIFRMSELDPLICGITILEVPAFRKSCRFDPPETKDHPTIKMLFDVLTSWPNDARLRLLWFIIGISRVPAAGFNPPVTIQLTGKTDHLPTGHLCPRSLLLPPYDSIEVLKEKLTRALTGEEGFGLL